MNNQQDGYLKLVIFVLLSLMIGLFITLGAG